MSAFFGVFQCGAPSCLHAHNEFVENLVNETKVLKKNAFLAPKTKHYQITT